MQQILMLLCGACLTLAGVFAGACIAMRRDKPPRMHRAAPPADPLESQWQALFGYDGNMTPKEATHGEDLSE